MFPKLAEEQVLAISSALLKIAKELTEQSRAQVKDENFVFPKQEKYPIHDKQHAMSALGFSKMHASPSVQEKVRAAVTKKYPGIELEKKKEAEAKVPEGGFRPGLFFTDEAKQALTPEEYALIKEEHPFGVIKRPGLIPLALFTSVGLGAFHALAGSPAHTRGLASASGLVGAPLVEYGIQRSGVFNDHTLRNVNTWLNEAKKAKEAKEKSAAAPKKEKRRPWNVANVRSGKRPMRVDTMLKKEKEGTLGVKLGQSSLREALFKLAQFYGPTLPFTDSTDKGAAPAAKRRMDNIPSADDVGGQVPKREDGRANLVTEMAPGTNLNEIAATNQPQERTASVKSAGVLRSVGNFLHHHEGPIEVAGLGYLAAPNIDNMQAKFRARRAGLADSHGHIPEDEIEKRRFIKERFHDPIEATGLGALAAPMIAKRLTHGSW